MSQPEQPQGIMEDLDLTKEVWIRDLLECPVCFEIPLPPIRLCIKGHIVCNSCRGRTNGFCPMCRNPYSETRNLVAEGIVSRCSFPCKYAGIGCDFIGKFGELEDHLSTCDYRPVECYRCNKRLVDYSDFKSHLVTHHRFKLLKCEPNEDALGLGIYHFDIKKVETCIWPQYFFEALDQVFLIRFCYLSDSSIGFPSSLNLWVSLFGLKSESNNYTASIEMHPSDPHDNGSQQSVHKWTQECPVNNFRDEEIKVIKGGGAMSIPIGEILLKCGRDFFENSGSEWQFRTVIHKKSSSTLKHLPPISFSELLLSPFTCPHPQPTLLQTSLTYGANYY